MEDSRNVSSRPSASRRRSKISNACIGCRNRKTRCSGRHPCERCVGRNEECIYEEKERKVAVSADYLDQLHARLKSLEARLQGANNANDNEPVPEVDHGSARDSPDMSPGNPQDDDEELTLYTEPEGLMNTLVTSEPQIKVHRYGHAAYLGHSSTLSFSRNVRNLLQQSSPVADPGSVSVERQDKSYATALPPIALDLSAVPLPRLSYAEYLTNTVLIHYGSLYSFFDPEKFLARLRAFYQQRVEGSVPEPSLWHIQMLLVLSFGKSILAREHSELGPSGMIDFTRALEAMPDIRRLYEEPLLSIEILSLAAIFMHATDMLQESYVTIGKAVRIAVTRIMNLAVPEVLKPTNVDYQRKLWWTVYCIDRKSTAMLGTLLVTRNEHISIPFPGIKEGDQAHNAFSIHVTLSSHLGKILDVIYGVHNQQRLNFVVEVKTILSRLAETFVVLQEHLDLDIHAPTQPVSRDAATLHLLFHQCVLLTVRPVLFSLLKPLLGEESIEENRRLLSSPFESMLKMCVESSILILKIIFTLKSQMMCDVFLPYDIDALSSAAFALVLIDIIRPANELLWDLSQVMGLLDEYVSRHVAPAYAYRSDLLHILELHTKIRGNDGPAQTDISAVRDTGQTPGLSRYAITNPVPTDISPDPVWSRVRHGNDPLVTAHLDTIRSVIDDLNVDNRETLDAVMLDGNFTWELDDLTEFL